MILLLGCAAFAACGSAPESTSPESAGGGGQAGNEPDAESPEAGGGGNIEPDAGAQPEAASPPEAAACIMPGSDCSNRRDDCCNGSTCVFNTQSPDVGTCAATCLDGSQCLSGCCKVLVEGREAVCAPEHYCAPACIQAGNSCIDQVNACCAGTTCVNNVLGTNCAANCVTGLDCVSGCCAPLDTGERVCSPPDYCAPACLSLGANCFTNPSGCCAGTTCGTDAIGSSCARLCTSPAQCPNNCCAPIGAQGQHVCAPEIDCL